MASLIAHTTAGDVEGLPKGDVVQFRGIRYARAARFAPPEPVEPSTGIRQASTFGPLAPQNSGQLEGLLGAPKMVYDEDCLYLNVFTPAVDDKARPVLFWIHGGGFVSGAGSTPWYDGSPLAAAGDVVVVTINYRLGALGFMAVDGFPGSGNNGIQDQIAALEWVRDNVAAFGGDPGNVTIFGESAGGMSVGTLLGTPAAAGLFYRAIAQSGAASNASTMDHAKAMTRRFLGELELEAEAEAALVDMDLEALLAAQMKINLSIVGESGVSLPFQPVIDDVVLPSSPLAAVAAGSAAAVPLIVGTTRDEFNLFTLMDPDRGRLDPDRIRRRLGRALGEDVANAAVDAYRAAYPERTWDELWSAMVTDRVFRIPALELAEAQGAHQPQTYAYLFTYESTAFDGAMGAAHSLDVPFVFNNLHRTGVDWLLGGVTDEAQELAKAMSTAWIAMARSGVPAAEGMPEWRPYSPADRAVMELGPERRLLVDPEGDTREFWASVSH